MTISKVLSDGKTPHSDSYLLCTAHCSWSSISLLTPTFSSTLFITEKDNYKMWGLKLKSTLLDKWFPGKPSADDQPWTDRNAGSLFRKQKGVQAAGPPKSSLHSLPQPQRSTCAPQYPGDQLLQPGNGRSGFLKKQSPIATSIWVYLLPLCWREKLNLVFSFTSNKPSLLNKLFVLLPSQ